MTSEFEEIFAADGTSRVLQHQRRPIYQEGVHVVADDMSILAHFKNAWENSALAALPEHENMRVTPLLDRLHFRRSWITRLVNGRPYRRTASNRKRRARYYRSK